MNAMDLTLDHLLYAGPELERLRRELRRLTGVSAETGGRHEGQGTHNALVGLGAGTYLELIAPDPEQEAGAFRDAIASLLGAELHAWCARTNDADALQTRIEATGCGVARHAFSRVTPEGEHLRWELLFATGHTWRGVAPFFIDWGETVHPTGRLTPAARLRNLTMLHPHAAEVSRWLEEVGFGAELGGRLRVESAPARGLRAEFEGARGPVALRGGAGGMHPPDTTPRREPTRS